MAVVLRNTAACRNDIPAADIPNNGVPEKFQSVLGLDPNQCTLRLAGGHTNTTDQNRRHEPLNDAATHASDLSSALPRSNGNTENTNNPAVNNRVINGDNKLFNFKTSSRGGSKGTGRNSHALKLNGRPRSLAAVAERPPEQNGSNVNDNAVDNNRRRCPPASRKSSNRRQSSNNRVNSLPKAELENEARVVDEKTQNTYIIRSRLGTGTFAHVYALKCERTRELFAAKSFSRDIFRDDETKKAVVTELAVCATMRHPNVVRTHSVFTDNLNSYIIMDLCEHGSLDTLTKSRTKLTDAEVLYFARGVLRGLDYLHTQQKVIHRDLKPANVFLDESMHAKIGDFGLSIAIEPNESTYRRKPCGTPAFLAPEIIRHEEYNEKIDIWAFGCIFYLMLQGKLPFYERNTEATFGKICDGSYAIPLALKNGFEKLAFDFIKKVFVLQQTDRPSAAQLLQHKLLTVYPVPQFLPQEARKSRPEMRQDIRRTFSRSASGSKSSSSSMATKSIAVRKEDNVLVEPSKEKFVKFFRLFHRVVGAITIPANQKGYQHDFDDEIVSCWACSSTTTTTSKPPSALDENLVSVHPARNISISPGARPNVADNDDAALALRKTQPPAAATSSSLSNFNKHSTKNDFYAVHQAVRTASELFAAQADEFLTKFGDLFDKPPPNYQSECCFVFVMRLTYIPGSIAPKSSSSVDYADDLFPNSRSKSGAEDAESSQNLTTNTPDPTLPEIHLKPPGDFVLYELNDDSHGLIYADGMHLLRYKKQIVVEHYLPNKTAVAAAETTDDAESENHPPQPRRSTRLNARAPTKSALSVKNPDASAAQPQADSSSTISGGSGDQLHDENNTARATLLHPYYYVPDRLVEPLHFLMCLKRVAQQFGKQPPALLSNTDDNHLHAFAAGGNLTASSPIVLLHDWATTRHVQTQLPSSVDAGPNRTQKAANAKTRHRPTTTKSGIDLFWLTNDVVQIDFEADRQCFFMLLEYGHVLIPLSALNFRSPPCCEAKAYANSAVVSEPFVPISMALILGYGCSRRLHEKLLKCYFIMETFLMQRNML